MLYPSNRNDIGRARNFNPKKEAKKLKEKELVALENPANEQAGPSSSKKGISFASFAEDNEGNLLKTKKKYKEKDKLKMLNKDGIQSHSQKIKEKIKPIQKNPHSEIRLKGLKSLSKGIVEDVEKSKALDKYRDLNLIGDTDRILETDESALKQMFGHARAYIA